MKPKASLQEIWDRELNYAQQPKFWESFAIETKCCANFFLKKYENVIYNDEPDEDFRGFFGYKYIRMLFGYALENIIKGQLLSGPNKDKYIKNSKITFGINGHNLIWLLNELDIAVSEKQEFYLKGWSISAEWFGKYPFPAGMNQILPEYRPLASSEALLRRSTQGKRDFLHNDLLHQQIGNLEIECFEAIFSSVQLLYKA